MKVRIRKANCRNWTRPCMFAMKHIPSYYTEWRLQGDDSPNGNQLHAQSRELCILFPFVKIEAEVKWSQSPPAEKERDTLLWKGTEPVTPASHPLLPGLPQLLSSESSPFQKSRRHAEAKIAAQFPFAAYTEGWDPGVSPGCSYKVLGTPSSYRILHRLFVIFMN